MDEEHHAGGSGEAAGEDSHGAGRGALGMRFGRAHRGRRPRGCRVVDMSEAEPRLSRASKTPRNVPLACERCRCPSTRVVVDTDHDEIRGYRVPFDWRGERQCDTCYRASSDHVWRTCRATGMALRLAITNSIRATSIVRLKPHLFREEFRDEKRPWEFGFLIRPTLKDVAGPNDLRQSERPLLRGQIDQEVLEEREMA
jgi:hypothetical protein